MTEIPKLCCSIPVWMILTFTQGHSCIKWHDFLCSFSHLTSQLILLKVGVPPWPGELKLMLDFVYMITSLMSWTTPHHTNCNPEPQDPCSISYFTLRYFEGSEGFSFILCLLVKIDIPKLKISSLLLSYNRTGVGTLMFFNRKLRANIQGRERCYVGFCKVYERIFFKLGVVVGMNKPCILIPV